MKVTCANCSGVFENDEAACPYCGYINVAGAEQEYLEDLGEIIEDFEDVPNIHKDQLKNQAVSKTKKTFKIFIIVAAALISLIISYSLMLAIFDRPYQTVDQQKDQLLWEKETFPKLDELYEKGDYDAIIEFIDDVYANEDNNYYFGTWEHTDFVFCYDDYRQFLEVKKSGENGEQYTDYEIGSILYNVLKARNSYYYDYLTKEDGEVVKGYVQEQYDFLIAEFLYTNEEIDQIYEVATQDGYLNIGIVYDEGEEREAKLYD